MALSHQVNGKEEVGLDLPLRQRVREAHTIDGVTNNPYSVPKLVKAGCVPIFERDEFVIYDTRDTKIRAPPYSADITTRVPSCGTSPSCNKQQQMISPR